MICSVSRFRKRSDGDFDCPNGEDEQNCPFICPYPQFYKCSDTGICISTSQLCNGIPDCLNGEDEYPGLCAGGMGGMGYRPYGARSARSFISKNVTLEK